MTELARSLGDFFPKSIELVLLEFRSVNQINRCIFPGVFIGILFPIDLRSMPIDIVRIRAEQGGDIEAVRASEAARFRKTLAERIAAEQAVQRQAAPA